MASRFVQGTEQEQLELEVELKQADGSEPKENIVKQKCADLWYETEPDCTTLAIRTN